MKLPSHSLIKSTNIYFMQEVHAVIQYIAAGKMQNHAEELVSGPLSHPSSPLLLANTNHQEPFCFLSSFMFEPLSCLSVS